MKDFSILSLIASVRDRLNREVLHLTAARVLVIGPAPACCGRVPGGWLAMPPRVRVTR